MESLGNFLDIGRLGIQTRPVVSLGTMAQWVIATILSIIFIGSRGVFRWSLVVLNLILRIAGTHRRRQCASWRIMLNWCLLSVAFSDLHICSLFIIGYGILEDLINGIHWFQPVSVCTYLERQLVL